MNSRTVALLAIVGGLVVLCLGIWYIWNAQQSFRSEMLYVRNQCDNLQKYVSASPALPSSPSPAHTIETPDPQPTDTTTPTTDSVVHRSCALSSAVHDVECTDGTDGTGDTDDETDATDEEYDDNDQDVDTADLVEANTSHTDVKLDDADEVADEVTDEVTDEGEADTVETTNELVESLLSSIVQQVDEVDGGTVTELDATAQTTQTDESVSVEDFVEGKGNYEALADTLRKKTVVELKKMCAEHEIGIKKGKSFKRKEELIEELVDKLPQSAV